MICRASSTNSLTMWPTGTISRTRPAGVLTHRQIHRIDIAGGAGIRRKPHEAQHRHGLPADDGLTDHRLVRAGFLTASFLAEPLPHQLRPQSSVRGVWPPVTEQDGPDRVRFARLKHLLLVVGVGA